MTQDRAPDNLSNVSWEARDDAELLVGALRDREAFAVFYRQHALVVHRWFAYDQHDRAGGAIARVPRPARAAGPARVPDQGGGFVKTAVPEQLETLGRQLDAAWERRYGPVASRARLRRSRAARALVVSAALAAAAAVVLARGSGPGAVEQALAAVADLPADAIVHFTSVSRTPEGGLIERLEMWGATSQPYARRWIVEGPGHPPFEQGARGDEFMKFDPAGNLVYVRTLAGGTAEGTRPADFGASAERVKYLLRQDSTRDEGEVLVDGRTLHRFAISPVEGGTCAYDVDPVTYVGVRLICNGLPHGSTSERWEYLSRESNEALLSVAAQHPSSRVDRGPMPVCTGNGRHSASTPPCVAYSPGG